MKIVLSQFVMFAVCGSALLSGMFCEIEERSMELISREDVFSVVDAAKYDDWKVMVVHDHDHWVVVYWRFRLRDGAGLLWTKCVVSWSLKEMRVILVREPW